jgi:hypothetical protein
MAWPKPSDYQDAVQNPAHCFSDPRLRAAQPALGPLGLPKVASGNYCSVYQMRSGGRRWAVRCFNRQVPDAERRYRTIDAHLERHPLPWFVGFDFLREGIRIHGRWYPVVVMDWVEGDTLSRYLEEHVREGAAVRALADQWPRLMADLRGAGIAHGDLQHGNILVAQDTFQLVDYDNLFVPAFQGEPSPELGRLHYQHPGRTADDFDLDVGNFSALVVYLSLRALAADPSLWRFYNGENLVLTADDYKRPATSVALAQMRRSPDPLVPRLAAELARCSTLPVSQVPALEAVLASVGVPLAAPGSAATAPPPRSGGGAPGWLDPSPPAASGAPSAPSAPRGRRPAPAPVPGDPWWEEAEPATTPAPPAPAPQRPRRPGRLSWPGSSRSSTAPSPSAQRPAPSAAGGAGGAGTRAGAQQPAQTRQPAGSVGLLGGCLASLVRSCMLVVALALLVLLSAGYWLYLNWERIGPYVVLPPITAPQGGGSSGPSPEERPTTGEKPVPPEPKGPAAAGSRPDSRQETPATRPSSPPGPPRRSEPPGPSGRAPTSRPDRQPKTAPDAQPKAPKPTPPQGR